VGGPTRPPNPAGADQAGRPRGRGLARERTVLSWNRSGLALVVCIAVLLRHLWPIETAGELVAVAGIAVAGIVWAVGLLLFTSATAGRDEEGLFGERVFGLMTTATVLLALAGFVLAFFGPD
jgi:uncharacterized membrane protein YidH (DUF202 family)